MKRTRTVAEVTDMPHLKRSYRATLSVCLMAALAACSGDDEAPPPSEPPAKMVTVSVGVSNAETMTYTDPGSPDGVTTVPTTDGDGRWGVKAVEVTVPAGTTVRLQANGASPNRRGMLDHRSHRPTQAH